MSKTPFPERSKWAKAIGRAPPPRLCLNQEMSPCLSPQRSTPGCAGVSALFQQLEGPSRESTQRRRDVKMGRCREVRSTKSPGQIGRNYSEKAGAGSIGMWEARITTKNTKSTKGLGRMRRQCDGCSLSKEVTKLFRAGSDARSRSRLVWGFLPTAPALTSRAAEGSAEESSPRSLPLAASGLSALHGGYRHGSLGTRKNLRFRPSMHLDFFRNRRVRNRFRCLLVFCALGVLGG